MCYSTVVQIELIFGFWVALDEQIPVFVGTHSVLRLPPTCLLKSKLYYTVLIFH